MSEKHLNQAILNAAPKLRLLESAGRIAQASEMRPLTGDEIRKLAGASRAAWGQSSKCDDPFDFDEWARI